MDMEECGLQDLFLRDSGQDETSKSEMNNNLEASKNDCFINRLPDEIMIKIFSYFELDEMCLMVPLVCKRWNLLSYDPYFYRELFITRYTKIKKIAIIIKRFSSVTKLTIIFVPKPNEFLSLVAENCNKLKILSIQLSYLSSVILNLVIENNPNLTQLSINGNQIASLRSADQIDFTKLKNIKHLDIGDRSWFTDKALSKIADNCSLHTLNIAGASLITESTLIELFTKIGHSLTDLSLDGKNFAEKTFEALKYCHNLTYFSMVSSLNMTNIALRMFPKLNKLSSLTIHRNDKIKSLGFQSFFRSGKMSNIEVLVLEEIICIDDNVLISISESCSKLCDLTLDKCSRITDRGIDNIVKRCKNMMQLGLADLTQITGNPFIDILEKLPKLTYINFRGCFAVNESILSTIVNKYPSLKISKPR